MGRLFGTDGLRGKVGAFPLDHATVELLGRILYFYFLEHSFQPEMIVGRDTRSSGPILLDALCRGFTASGGNIDEAGIASTPALAYLAKSEGKCAVSITASHNPHDDNGIKIFGPDGLKLSEQSEAEIEPFLLGEKAFQPSGASSTPGSRREMSEYLHSKYCDYLKQELFNDLDLSGTRFVLDCANGALCSLAVRVMRQFGADVVPINIEPNGTNINDHCGSLYPEKLLEYVRENSLGFGFTFDGDGDRCLASDQKSIYDGDFILGASARYLQKRGHLVKNEVVATSMSNLGLEVFLKQHGIMLHRVPVGDKYVLEKLQQDGLSLGGEQSGHIIFMNQSSIGDGLVTALQVLRIYKDSGVPFSEIWGGMKKYPQILLNVPVQKKPPLESIPEIQEGMESIQRELGDSGRMVVRYSGTENVARIMIEGPDQNDIERMANSLAAIVKKQLS